MKSIISKSMALVALTATLFSFTTHGGEGFEVLLNNKVMIRQFAPNLNTVQSLKLGKSSENDALTVKYHHCGQVGKNRIITFKNEQNKILKEWRFADATGSVAGAMAMNFSVKEILKLSKGNETVIRLYYASSELPNGRLLANIITQDSHVAAK